MMRPSSSLPDLRGFRTQRRLQVFFHLLRIPFDPLSRLFMNQLRNCWILINSWLRLPFLFASVVPFKTLSMGFLLLSQRLCASTEPKQPKNPIELSSNHPLMVVFSYVRGC
jgi:hypothetical protein